MALTTVHQGEDQHALGEMGAKRIYRWLNSTGRFNMSHTAYDLDPQSGQPTDHCRVEQLNGSVEKFDLFGELLGKDAKPGDRIYVECKNYESAANQGKLYREYLAVCYSAFYRRWEAASAEPSEQYMWATSHPFSLSEWAGLCKFEAIQAACQDPEYVPRLGGKGFDADVARALAPRLWLSIVNGRVEEMMMGDELLGAVRAAMVKMA
jgi:hypothetical protein